MLSDERVAKIIGQELDAAVAMLTGADNGRMQRAIDYAEGLLPANDDKNADPNREAVSLDVADMVEAVYAQMAPALEDAGGIQFDAVSADDEPQAQQESEIVRLMLLEGYAAEGGFVSLSECIKDCLLLRTGVLALWIDRTETSEPEQWEAVPELALGDLITPSEEGQRIEGVSVEPDEEADKEAKQAHEQSAAANDSQAPPTDERAGPQNFYKVSFTRISVDKRLCVTAVPREGYVTSSLAERDPNRCRFSADRIVTTRARLTAEGFDQAKVLQCKRHEPSTYELYLRRGDGADDAKASTANAPQDATETVEIWRCYPLLADADETTTAAKRYRVYYSRDAKILLSKPEPIGRVCYGVGNTMLYPHRLDGVSLFDRLGEVQEVKTRALRDWIENSRKVNRPRLGVDETLANIGDAKDATADIIRIKSPTAIVPIPTVDAGPSMSALMGYMDQARSERGGASLDMQSSAMQIASNQTAQGIERQYSVKEAMAAMMARTFGETALRAAYQIAHYLLRTQWGGMLTVKVGGDWVQVDPSKWRARNGVRVRLGQSETQRMRRLVALQGVLQMQTQAMQSGMDGILVDASRLFNTASDLVTASQLSGPERYLIDPSSPQAKQAANDKQAAQQRSTESQAAGMRAALLLDKYKTDIGAWGKLLDTFSKAAIEEAKLMMSPTPIDQAQQLTGAGVAAAGNQAQSAAAAGQGGAGDGDEQGGAPPGGQQQPELEGAGQ